MEGFCTFPSPCLAGPLHPGPLQTLQSSACSSTVRPPMAQLYLKMGYLFLRIFSEIPSELQIDLFQPHGFRCHPHAEDAPMCPSQPDISPTLWTWTYNCPFDGPMGVAHRHLELIRTQAASGLPLTKPAPPAASPFLTSGPSGLQTRTWPQPLSSFQTPTCQLHLQHHPESAQFSPPLQLPLSSQCLDSLNL